MLCPSLSIPSKSAVFGGFLDAAVVCELLFGANNIMLEELYESAKLRSAQDEEQLSTSPSDALQCSTEGVEVSPQLKVLRCHPAEVF